MAENVGLFGQYNLPQISRAEAEKLRRQQRAQAFQEKMALYSEGMAPGQRGLFMSMAQMGMGLGGGTRGPVLTDAEKRQFDIVESANARIDALRKDKEFTSLSPEEQSFRVQDELGKAMADAGDYSGFSQVALDNAKRKMAKQKADLELKKLTQDVQAGTQAFKVTEESRKRALAGEHVTVALPGADGSWNFEDLPEVAAGRVNDNGDLETPDGILPEGSFMPLDEWTRLNTAFNSTDKAKAARSKVPDVKTMNAFLGGASQVQKFGEQITDVVASTAILKAVKGAVTNAMQRGQDGRAVVGSAGVFNTFMQRVMDTAGGIMTNFTPNGNIVQNTDKDGNIVSARDVDGVIRFLGDLIKLPPGMRETSQDAMLYRSAVVQALYLDARVEEPGARQLSDNDIIRAADRLGVNSGDPEHIFTTLISKFGRGADKVRNRFDHELNRAEAWFNPMGFNGRDSMDRYLGRPLKALDEVDREQQELFDEFEKLFVRKPAATRPDPNTMGTQPTKPETKRERAARIQAILGGE